MQTVRTKNSAGMSAWEGKGISIFQLPCMQRKEHAALIRWNSDEKHFVQVAQAIQSLGHLLKRAIYVHNTKWIAMVQLLTMHGFMAKRMRISLRTSAITQHLHKFTNCMMRNSWGCAQARIWRTLIWTVVGLCTQFNWQTAHARARGVELKPWTQTRRRVYMYVHPTLNSRFWSCQVHAWDSRYLYKVSAVTICIAPLPWG